MLSVEIIADYCDSLWSISVEDVQISCLLKKMVHVVTTALKYKLFYDSKSYVDITNRTAYVLKEIAA